MNPPGCNWNWNWDSHWYGWTFYMNDCAASVIRDWLWGIGAGAAFIAAMQAFLNVPVDIAAVVAGAAGNLGAGALAAQISTCEALGYGGVGYGTLWVPVAYLYC
ncbi:MAG TPA: hypothetical protein VIO84_06265 [Candidatus Dormibacteraeota bacterium]